MMVIRVVMLFKAHQHLFEHLFAIAAQHVCRRHVPEITELGFINLKPRVQTYGVAEGFAVRRLRMRQRTVEVEDETVEGHGAQRMEIPSPHATGDVLAVM